MKTYSCCLYKGETPSVSARKLALGVPVSGRPWNENTVGMHWHDADGDEGGVNGEGDGVRDILNKATLLHSLPNIRWCATTRCVHQTNTN